MLFMRAAEPNWPGPEEPTPQPAQPELPPKKPSEPEWPPPDPGNPPGPGPTDPGAPSPLSHGSTLEFWYVDTQGRRQCYLVILLID